MVAVEVAAPVAVFIREKTGGLRWVNSKVNAVAFLLLAGDLQVVTGKVNGKVNAVAVAFIND